jgi:hypothetical protein
MIRNLNDLTDAITDEIRGHVKDYVEGLIDINELTGAIDYCVPDMLAKGQKEIKDYYFASKEDSRPKRGEEWKSKR